MCLRSIRGPPARALSCSIMMARSWRTSRANIRSTTPLQAGWSMIQSRSGQPTRHRARRVGAKRRGAGRRGRDRHHEPARDHAALGARHRPAGASRHRLAGPPHGAAVRRAARRRPGRLRAGAHGSGDRSLLLSHQAALAAGACTRGAGARRTRRAGLRHRRYLLALAPDRWAPASHGRLECLSHHAVRHPYPGLG